MLIASVFRKMIIARFGATIAIGQILFACGGRTTTSKQDCSDMPEAPYIHACVVSGPTSVEDYAATQTLVATGTLTSVTEGPVAGGCISWLPVGNSSVVLVLKVNAMINGETTDIDVEYAAPAFDTLWRAGDTVTVDYRKAGGMWQPEDIDLTLSHGQAVDVYIGHGGQVSDFSQTPFTFVQGQARCTANDTCGSWSGYDMEVVQSSGNVLLPFGSSLDIAGYRVVHGGVRWQLSTASHCLDWFVADASVAVMRKP